MMTAAIVAGRAWRGAWCTALTLVVSLGSGISADSKQASEAQTPTFRAVTTLVTTDVIPRDSKGQFVADLTRDEFIVLEDGLRQTVASFAVVRGGRVINLLAPPPAAAAEGILLPAAKPHAAADGSSRVFLIVIDDLHIEAEYTPHVRRLVQTLASTLLHDGDLVALVSTGPSAVATGATYDRAAIASAASQIRGSGITAAEIFQMPETRQGPADLRRRAQTAFQSVYRAIRDLEQVRDRRKAVIYISNGYDLDPFVAGRQGRDRIQGGRFSDPTRFMADAEDPYLRTAAATADIDLFAYMRELTLSANRANATIYPVDPRGLAGVVDAGQYVDQSEWREFLQKTQSGLRYLSEETGGFAVVNVNDFAGEFKRIDADTRDYYLLGYYSTNPDTGKRVRALEVKVSRPGIEVAARSGYSLRPLDMLAPAARQERRR